jgi:hypothetical protein
MLAWKLVVEAQPLRSQGWSLSAIARHLGVKQVARSRLSERRTCPGSAGACGDRSVREYVFCCWLRLSGELRAWLTTLFEEVAQLGQAGSLPAAVTPPLPKGDSPGAGDQVPRRVDAHRRPDE